MPYKKWKVLQSEHILNCQPFNVRHDVCKTLKGNTVDYYVVERQRAVGIAAFTAQNKIILERQYRHAYGGWLIEIPAGLVEGGEELEAAMRRELLEETGYEVGTCSSLREFLPSPGILQQQFTLFLGLHALKVREPKFDESEEIEIFLVDFSQAVKMVLNGEIQSVESVAGILLVKEFIERRNYASS